MNQIRTWTLLYNWTSSSQTRTGLQHMFLFILILVVHKDCVNYRDNFHLPFSFPVGRGKNSKWFT